MDGRDGDSAWGDDLVAQHRWMEAGFAHPVLGHRVRIGTRTYKLDVSYPDLLVAFEYDGWQWHKERTSFDHDRERIRDLELAGWTVLPYTSASTRADVVRDADRAGVPRQRLVNR